MRSVRAGQKQFGQHCDTREPTTTEQTTGQRASTTPRTRIHAADHAPRSRGGTELGAIFFRDRSSLNCEPLGQADGSDFITAWLSSVAVALASGVATVIIGGVEPFVLDIFPEAPQAPEPSASPSAGRQLPLLSQ